MNTVKKAFKGHRGKKPVKVPKEEKEASDINFAVYLGDYQDKDLIDTVKTAQKAIAQLRVSANGVRGLTPYAIGCLNSLDEALDGYIHELEKE